MIKLHGFGPQFGLADPSPYVLSVDTFLRLAKIPYEFDGDSNNLSRAPKGKLPYITDGEQQLADSFLIIEHLSLNNPVTLNRHLDAKQLATAHLIQQSLNEHFYFCLIHSRWLKDDTWPRVKQAFFGNMPPVIKQVIPAIIRGKVRKGMKAQGFARHSDAEILHFTELQLQALSAVLADQDYFFGAQASTLDAVCFGFLAQVILAEIDNPCNTLARQHDNLVAFCQRIQQQYY